MDAAVPHHVALLAENLAAVPPSAVPAIVDCVIASAAISPSNLFHFLLDSLPDPSEARRSNRVLSIFNALCHLIKNTDVPADAFRLFISRVLLPQLEKMDSGESDLLNQIEVLLCDVISKTRSWALMGETLVPFCMRTLILCAGVDHNEGFIQRWSGEFGQGFTASSMGALPLPTACHILTSLLECALRSGKETQIMEGKLVDGFSPSDDFAANLIWDLSELALELLVQSSENRSCAIRLLLPTVLSLLNSFGSVGVSVHSSPHTLSRAGFSRKIWNFCMSLFSLGHIERLDAYNILTLYFSSRHMSGSLDSTNKEFDLLEQRELWDEIRSGLVDKNASVRKQALYILKISLIHSSLLESEYDMFCPNDSAPSMVATNTQNISCDGSEQVDLTRRERWADKEAKSLGVGKFCHLYDYNLSGQERWKVFFLLYEMLEEYGTHLVEAAWNHQASLDLLKFYSQPLYSEHAFAYLLHMVY